MINIEDSALDLKRWNLIIQNAVIEILGEDQAEAIINLSNQPSISIIYVHQSLEKLVGSPSLAGVEFRIGQAAFRQFLTTMGIELGFFHPSYKYSNFRKKTVDGFTGLIELYQKLTDEKASFFETAELYRLSIWANSEGTQKIIPGCQYLIGFIKEFMNWVSCGKVYDVYEERCRNLGHEKCVYNINKTILE